LQNWQIGYKVYVTNQRNYYNKRILKKWPDFIIYDKAHSSCDIGIMINTEVTGTI
jgi:hypothetical protein